MINHSNCDHPRTSSARAKCRRSGGNYSEKVGFAPPLYSLGPPPGPGRRVIGKKEREERDDNYGQTPRDKEKECMVCGVERIEFKGTDPLTGLTLYVGERCTYMVKRADDFVALP
jgi:hypothetical protein